MKTQIINIVAKVGPHVKTIGKLAAAGAVGVAEALSEHNKAKQMEDLVKRVTELEKLVNKQ